MGNSNSKSRLDVLMGQDSGWDEIDALRSSISSFHDDDINPIRRTPIPALESQGTPRRIAHFSKAAEYHQEYATRLERLQMAYFTGQLNEARTLSEELMTSGDPTIKLSSTTTHMNASIALGDGQTAYTDLTEIIKMCSEGMYQVGDYMFYRTAVLCAMRAEGVTMSRYFDIPTAENGIDGLPTGLKAYLGYQYALKYMRMGQHKMAAGISEAFKLIVGEHYPIPKIFLHLVSAATYMVDAKCDLAVEEYKKAWELSKTNGIIMPFVELNFTLLGLPRNYFKSIESNEYKRIENMVRHYHEGWFELRRLCGLEVFGEDLTPLEAYVAALAYLGWRNKEISSHLHISENTVKHQLTIVYQKLGVKSRSAVKELFQEKAKHNEFML